jgi:hypothetical protein
MNFRIGQKVVCVDTTTSLPGSNGLWHPDCDVPVQGEVYTVRAVGAKARGLLGIKLKEIVCVAHTNGVLCRDEFYWAARFRPLVESKTSTGMAILESILANPKQKIQEKIDA